MATKKFSAFNEATELNEVQELVGLSNSVENIKVPMGLLTPLKGVQSFGANGTYTPTPGTTKIHVRLTGAGGGGGGAQSGSNKSTASGGGGGGTVEFYMEVSDQLTASIVIGAGGAGGSGADGTAGADSTFTYEGTVVTADGGNKGIAGPNDSGNNFLIVADPVGGNVSGSLIASFIRESVLGTNALYSSATNLVISGSGGDAHRGGQGRGRTSGGGNNSANGFPASSNSGAGGSGAYQADNTTKTGGNGGSGSCLIEEF